MKKNDLVAKMTDEEIEKRNKDKIDKERGAVKAAYEGCLYLLNSINGLFNILDDFPMDEAYEDITCNMRDVLEKMEDTKIKILGVAERKGFLKFE